VTLRTAGRAYNKVTERQVKRSEVDSHGDVKHEGIRFALDIERQVGGDYINHPMMLTV